MAERLARVICWITCHWCTATTDVAHSPLQNARADGPAVNLKRHRWESGLKRTGDNSPPEGLESRLFRQSPTRVVDFLPGVSRRS